MHHKAFDSQALPRPAGKSLWHHQTFSLVLWAVINETMKTHSPRV